MPMPDASLLGGSHGARWTRHRRVFLPVWLALVLLAWTLLWAWSLSPHARYLDHGGWTGPLADLCRTLPGGGWWLPTALAALAWLLMCIAMMLPTTLPLFDVFERVTAGRADRGLLLGLLGAGYLAVWGGFGLLAHGAHEALLAGVARLPWLADRAAWIGVATLAGAGAFQFSALKYRCLEQCRTPLSFVMAHWRGGSPRWQAWALGAHHGLFCIGCCWALMLLMFVVGMGHLGWMLVLAAVMAAEKNLPGGRRLSAPLGWALLAAAVLLAMRA
ncbi:DUF2182 domain-containing protein [Roseateles saccharophilus]|uniref:Putative metal-binding membrane protein n=1 Tax=Roseateles saccharophilus TaxID=304 RepID=A0A4R3VJ77_ROSSA|nr:DUF2182 domain-containing protein [Roseateles saccharophilus]TCV04451.1 putative metal-binding membrane protein [Roseateles saccharophilus]